jgi:hypothetical protein
MFDLTMTVGTISSAIGSSIMFILMALLGIELFPDAEIEYDSLSSILSPNSFAISSVF